ncbi:hypothetical protein [Nostoc flagelliforme]|nr:hypothetical protein [Nostoc flagelliforme]
MVKSSGGMQPDNLISYQAEIQLVNKTITARAGHTNGYENQSL